MAIIENKGLSAEETLRILDIALISTETKSLDEYIQRVLPQVSSLLSVQSIFLYLTDACLFTPRFYQLGLPDDRKHAAEQLCSDQLSRLSGKDALRKTVTNGDQLSGTIVLSSLHCADRTIGIIGYAREKNGVESASPAEEAVHRLIGSTLSDLIQHEDYERRLQHLNTYLNVSSMLSQSMGLHEILETTLYCVMDTISADTASILLLDDDKKNFSFYQIEGPAKPLLMTRTFPADKGLAGYCLHNNVSEVIHDVPSHPRFYNVIDSESGYQTRNMIIVPLIAGEEPIGVLEVINKADNGLFTEEERILLVSIAEEIAFAIRNAAIFDYVVSTYCRQRQGLGSCAGCKRPLGAWTPCVKYLESNV